MEKQLMVKHWEMEMPTLNKIGLKIFIRVDPEKELVYGYIHEAETYTNVFEVAGKVDEVINKIGLKAEQLYINELSSQIRQGDWAKKQLTELNIH